MHNRNIKYIKEVININVLIETTLYKEKPSSTNLYISKNSCSHIKGGEAVLLVKDKYIYIYKRTNPTNRSKKRIYSTKNFSPIEMYCPFCKKKIDIFFSEINADEYISNVKKSINRLRVLSQENPEEETIIKTQEIMKKELKSYFTGSVKSF